MAGLFDGPSAGQLVAEHPDRLTLGPFGHFGLVCQEQPGGEADLMLTAGGGRAVYIVRLDAASRLALAEQLAHPRPKAIPHPTPIDGKKK